MALSGNGSSWTISSGYICGLHLSTAALIIPEFWGLWHGAMYMGLNNINIWLPFHVLERQFFPDPGWPEDTSYIL